jgi:hypothetical protein
VDLIKIIHDLREERSKLDQIITSLEQLQSSAPVTFSSPSGGRRGRRFMGAEDRLEVSQRMKRYWEKRRQASTENSQDPRSASSAGGVNA